MARNLQMSWVQSQKRWTKQYRGQTYSVSCRQLDAPPTKEASWAAANLWWEAKRAAVDADARAAEPPPDATSVVVSRLLAAHGIEHVGELLLLRDRGEAAARLLQMVRDAGGGEGASSGLDAVDAGRPVLPPISPADLGRLDAMLGPADAGAAAGRSLGEHADRWVQSLRDAVAAKRMSPGRMDRYVQDATKFRRWLGEKAAVDDLATQTLDRWYSHLSGVVAEGGSTETARHAMMTIRQFVTWLAERGTIPLPLNIRSKSHRFRATAKKVKHFTPDEVKAILGAADAHSRRTKLYILLMLNCGMYQSDISDLRKDEIDWDARTITRKRSKRTHSPDAPEVCYPLWPETVDLLEEFQSKEGGRVLTTEDGNPLAEGKYVQGDDGGASKYTRYDTIRSSIERLAEWVPIPLPPKHFRKTSAQLLSQRQQFRHLPNIFLAQAPKGVAARNYLDESKSPGFRRAILWLGEQYGVGTAK